MILLNFLVYLEHFTSKLLAFCLFSCLCRYALLCDDVFFVLFRRKLNHKKNLMILNNTPLFLFHAQKCVSVVPSSKNTALFVCDVQETFRDKIVNMERLIYTSEFLIRSAKSLQLPIIITEQIPFKPTIAEITTLLPDTPVR